MRQFCGSDRHLFPVATTNRFCHSAYKVCDKMIYGSIGNRNGPRCFTFESTSTSLRWSSVRKNHSLGDGLQTRANGDMDKNASNEDTIPIFPLSLVALPAAQCPLHIFEARYRVLFSTLLDGSEGIDAGLVSPDKPWKGTRRFGMAYYDQKAGGLASVGTVLEIQDHSMLEDGRMLIENVGKERFKILNVVEEKPVLVCRVEYLEEDDDTADSIVSLGSEVGQLFKDVVKLSTKLKEVDVEQEILEPKELDSLGPRDLSFWVASLFAGNPYNQQALLEENDTEKRLTIEKELLENTLKYLSAQSALQSAFGGNDEKSSGEQL